MSGRRGLATAVVGVLVGAALVLLGASRVWWRETVPRPAPLRPEEILHTGASLAPVLPALGFVALAGAGALLATRGTIRRLVGALLAAVAVAVVGLVLATLGDPVSLVWPLTCLAGAVLVGVAGALAARYGDRWPVMGRRYDRGAEAGPRVSTEHPTADEASAGAASGNPGIGRTPTRATDSAELWDALDRGDDPTRR